MATIKQLLVLLSILTLTSCSQEKDKDNHQKENEISVVKAESQRLKTETDLPGSFEAYQDVPIHAKVQGFISWIGVDRGSSVKKGQKLIVITAPEVDAKVREAEAKLKSAQATYYQAESALASTANREVEMQAKLEADQFTYDRLKKAYETYAPAIAKNDVDVSGRAVAADVARVDAFKSEIGAAKNLMVSEKQNISAAQNLHEALQSMGRYLEIDAPFDGIVSERNVHEGSIVATDADRTGRVKPLLRVEEVDVLRLVVAVPEEYVAGVRLGDKISFTVSAYPGKVFYALVARPAFALERRTRTMPTELSFMNAERLVMPGMYANVRWPISRPYNTVFVPQTAIKTDLKESFVDKVRNGKIEKVRVVLGQPMGAYNEVIHGLKAGDEVALKANDELETGNQVKTKLATKKEIENLQTEKGENGG